jgi:hypothetical protein
MNQGTNNQFPLLLEIFLGEKIVCVKIWIADPLRTKLFGNMKMKKWFKMPQNK